MIRLFRLLLSLPSLPFVCGSNAKEGKSVSRVAGNAVICPPDMRIAAGAPCWQTLSARFAPGRIEAYFVSQDGAFA